MTSSSSTIRMAGMASENRETVMALGQWKDGAAAGSGYPAGQNRFVSL